MDASPLDRLRAAVAGRYTLERELGRGGMATVWLARDLKHDRLVALKVLRPELAAALGPERFLQGGEGVSMPSKTYYLLAAVAALRGLCRAGSDLAAVIDAHACGLHVSPRDAAQAAQAILRLRADPELLAQYRANARRAAEQHYSRAE